MRRPGDLCPECGRIYGPENVYCALEACRVFVEPVQPGDDLGEAGA